MPRKNPSPSADESARHHNRHSSLPTVAREYLDRRELLKLVPLSMSTIDALEKTGEFPSRFVLSPTIKVCWKRREVVQFLEQRAAKRVHAVHSPGAAQNRTNSTNQGVL